MFYYAGKFLSTPCAIFPQRVLSFDMRNGVVLQSVLDSRDNRCEMNFEFLHTVCVVLLGSSPENGGLLLMRTKFDEYFEEIFDDENKKRD